MPLEKFVDPLPLPRVLQPKRRKGGVTYYEGGYAPDSSQSPQGPSPYSSMGI